MLEIFPILYSFRRCPYAMRARFALAYSGIAYELREVDLKNKPTSLSEISPKATVPVLLLEDGTVIDQSLDIMKYAMEYHDPQGWFTGSPDEIEALITVNDTDFTPLLTRYKYHVRYEKSQEAYRHDAEHIFIKDIERRLQQHGYLIGESLSFADIAIFPFIRQFSMVEPEWFKSCPYSQIRQWLKTITDSSLYTVIIKKYSPWKQGDSPIFCPPLAIEGSLKKPF